jgi:hypothetical protein
MPNKSRWLVFACLAISACVSCKRAGEVRALAPDKLRLIVEVINYSDKCGHITYSDGRPVYYKGSTLRVLDPAEFRGTEVVINQWVNPKAEEAEQQQLDRIDTHLRSVGERLEFTIDRQAIVTPLNNEVEIVSDSLSDFTVLPK